MFICAVNMCRSVAAEALVKGEKGFQVRSRAAEPKSPRRVTPADCSWADEIYAMTPLLSKQVRKACPRVTPKKIHALWIPDVYHLCSEELFKDLKKALGEYAIHPTKSLWRAEEDCWEITRQKRQMDYKMLYPQTMRELSKLRNRRGLRGRLKRTTKSLKRLFR